MFDQPSCEGPVSKNIAIIQGHPDPAPERFCRAFADAYARSARAAGHSVEIIDVSALDFPLLRSKATYETCDAPAGLWAAQTTIQNADHLVVVFPLWLGDLPALLKGFLEQVLRPGFAYSGGMDQGRFKKLLKGKSARVVVTMGMPAFVYRLFYGAHGLKNLRRNILAFCGISPISESFIGLIEQDNPGARKSWLARAEAFGRDGV
jgi:putative NADPH-quinone reductase